MSQHPTARPGRQSPDARHRGPGSRRQAVLRVLAATVVVLALVTALAVVFVYRHLDGNLRVADIEAQLSDRPEKVEVEGPKEPLNVLVMGSDAREGEGNNIDGLTGGGARSDTTMLMHVSADRERAYGISIPRDSMVERPECTGEDGETIPASNGLEMFNNAFTVGGPACTLQTVEQLTGVRVDHWVMVDFHGFQGMVDAIDGVEVCIPEDAIDPAHGIALEAGTRTVRGREALNYVRERHKLSANGDIGRMKRQQAFIASMANKVVSAGTLARPDRLVKFLDAATESLTLDDDIGSLSRLADLGLQFRDTGLADIQFITTPFETYEPDPNRVIWTDEADRLWRHVQRDEALPAELLGGRITAAAPPGTGEPAGGSPSGTASPSESEAPPESTPPSGSASPSESASPERLTDEELAEQHGLCS